MLAIDYRGTQDVACDCCGAFQLESPGANTGLCDACKRHGAYRLSPAFYIGALEVMAYAWSSKTGVTCAPLSADYWLQGFAR
jgi:hypothetical protein